MYHSLKKKVTPSPKNHLENHFPRSVLLMKESFFRWTTQYSKSYKIRFISVGKPLISGPKCWDTARNPFAHFLLNERPIEKLSKCKEHSDLRVQWNLWKTARRGSTGCHEGFMSLGSSKKQGVGFSCQVTPLQDEFQTGKSNNFPFEHFSTSFIWKFRNADGEAMIFRPRSWPNWMGNSKKTTVFRQLWKDSAN